MQKILNSIVKYLKTNTILPVEYAWGHLDDLLVAHEDPVALEALAQHMLYLFNLVKWVVNIEKSVLKPTQNVIFLGARWLSDRVVRTTKATLECARIWAAISRSDETLTGRPLQQIRGFLNYYFSFAGNFHSVINRILNSKNKIRFNKIFIYLINKNTIFLNLPRINNSSNFVNFASDATKTQLAAMEMDNPSNAIIEKSNNNILVNELKAALLSLRLAAQKAIVEGRTFSARVYIDNKAVIAFLNQGRVKWTGKTVSIFQQFNIMLFFQSHLHTLSW